MTRTDDDSSNQIWKREEIELANCVLFIQQQYPTIKLKDKNGKVYNITQLEHFLKILQLRNNRNNPEIQ